MTLPSELIHLLFILFRLVIHFFLFIFPSAVMHFNRLVWIGYGVIPRLHSNLSLPTLGVAVVIFGHLNPLIPPEALGLYLYCFSTLLSHTSVYSPFHQIVRSLPSMPCLTAYSFSHVRESVATGLYGSFSYSFFRCSSVAYCFCALPLIGKMNICEAWSG